MRLRLPERRGLAERLFSAAACAAASAALAAVTDCRSALNPGPICFITRLSASSSGVIGGGSRLARSVIAPLITDVATIAGRPRYFAIASAASAGRVAFHLRRDRRAGSKRTTSPITVT